MINIDIYVIILHIKKTSNKVIEVLAFKQKEGYNSEREQTFSFDITTIKSLQTDDELYIEIFQNGGNGRRLLSNGNNFINISTKFFKI